ncbi:hypothetical protein D3C81_1254410 [compost metagenome]
MIAEHLAVIKRLRACFSRIAACSSSMAPFAGGRDGLFSDRFPLRATALGPVVGVSGRARVAIVVLGRRCRGAGVDHPVGQFARFAGLGDQRLHARIRQPAAGGRGTGGPLWATPAVPAGQRWFRVGDVLRLPCAGSVLAGPGARVARRGRCGGIGVGQRRVGAGVARPGPHARVCPAGYDLRCRPGAGATTCRRTA